MEKIKSISKRQWDAHVGENYAPTAAANGVFFQEIEREPTEREKAGLVGVRKNGPHSEITHYIWALTGELYNPDEYPGS